jgi:uncharacterized membrane protein
MTSSHDEEPAPYIPPPSDAPRKTVTRLQWSGPLVWLRKGLQDMRAHPGIAIFYGFIFQLMAVTVAAVFRGSPQYTMTIASGCLLVGPFLAMGLYEVSRRRESGAHPTLGASVTCWDRHLGSMAMLVLVLIVLELLWGRASLVVFAVFFNTGMPSAAGVMDAVFNPQNLEFLLAYTVVGGVFAALVFALTVVSIPMILDRDTDAVFAAITSLEVVLSNPRVMVWWGALLSMLLLGALLLPWQVGLWIVGPWLGHASWHAYRDAVRWPPEAREAQASDDR